MPATVSRRPTRSRSACAISAASRNFPRASIRRRAGAEPSSPRTTGSTWVRISMHASRRPLTAVMAAPRKRATCSLRRAFERLDAIMKSNAVKASDWGLTPISKWGRTAIAPISLPALSFLTQASAPAQIEQLAGNKGASLYRLASLGVPVPHWAILGADWFAAFRQESGVDQRIAALLQDFTPAEAGTIAQAIAEAVLACDLSPAMRAGIARALAHIGDGSIAVRSSGVEEDGTDFSFAGQFDTFLDVRGLASTVEHVRKCWASAYSERSLLYRHQHGLDIAATEMAVILQRLAPAEKSAVIFTAKPANAHPEAI